LHYSSLTAQEQAAFQRRFKQLVAARAGVLMSDISISRIRTGSTIVTCIVFVFTEVVAQALVNMLVNSVESIFCEDTTFFEYGTASSSSVTTIPVDGAEPEDSDATLRFDAGDDDEEVIQPPQSRELQLPRERQLSSCCASVIKLVAISKLHSVLGAPVPDDLR
jgi:hypothetical protein